MGKDPIKKSLTNVATIGPSSAITDVSLISVPGRSSDGGNVTIRDSQGINSLCNVGDIIKYVNIRIQSGPTDETPEDDTSGWIEWAIVKFKEGKVTVPTTNIGILTLGDICTKMFRGDCCLTGAMPIGGDQPSVQDIVFKIQLASELVIFLAFRSTNAASVATNLNRLIVSANYKDYV